MKRIAAIALPLQILGFACAGTAPLPPKALALNQAGVEALAAGDLETADARFGLALEYNPKFVDALTNQGLVELQRGNLERARQLLTRARRLNPDVAQPHHALGVLAERERRPDLASQAYYEALRVDPGFAPSRANLAHLLYDSGLYEDALLQFKRLVEVAPDVIAAHVGLAGTLLHLERVGEASQVIENALAAAADDPELSILAARLQIRRGEFEAAIARLSPLTQARSELAVHALAWLAAAELARGRLEAAVGAAERAIALAPDDALASYALGVSLKKLGDPGAQRWLERASALSPGVQVALDSVR
ncbi:MAG TPA: tetratricopeptide repeat protein [Polyangiaceae bacterium]|nr:tetratricopeptide repeat protein [Polyangiaceae bacterium]